MPGKTYTYDPARLPESGKDRMRFELGDTMVEGGAETAYLSDEEIVAVLGIYPQWLQAKLALVESVLRRFAYEVDTRVGPVSWSLSDRYAAWQKLYDDIKTEARAKCALPSDPTVNRSGPPYFRGGVHDNRDLLGRGRHQPCTLDRGI